MLFTASIIDFHVIQSTDAIIQLHYCLATIEITMVTWYKWLSHLFQKLPQALSSSSCQIISSQIHYQMALKVFSSNIVALSYWWSYIFRRFIPYTFVDFIDSDDYNSAQRKEHVVEFQATIPAKTSIPTVQLWVHCLRQHDHAQPRHVSRWARIKAKLCSYSCCWFIIKWPIQLTHLGAVEKITEVSLVDICEGDTANEATMIDNSKTGANKRWCPAGTADILRL